MELRGGREGARCVEQRRDGRGGRCDRNIDGVPKRVWCAGRGGAEKGPGKGEGRARLWATYPRGGDIFCLSPPRAIQPLSQLRGEPIQVNPLDRVNRYVTCSNYSRDVVTVGAFLWLCTIVRCSLSTINTATSISWQQRISLLFFLYFFFRFSRCFSADFYI